MDGRTCMDRQQVADSTNDCINFASNRLVKEFIAVPVNMIKKCTSLVII